MQVTEFDKKTALLFKSTIQARIADIAKDFGVSINVSNIKMPSRKTMTMTLTAGLGEMHLEDTQSGRMFLAHCKSFGISKEMLGETVIVNEEVFKIVGLSPNAPKYPIMAERVRDGKSFKLTAREAKAKSLKIEEAKKNVAIAKVNEITKAEREKLGGSSW